MPRKDGESDEQWNHCGPFYAIMKRVQDQKDFFDRVAKLRPRFMAVFDATSSKFFNTIREARTHVYVSAQALCYAQPGYFNGPARQKMECDIWDGRLNRTGTCFI
jgi:hypothetical protein